MTLLQKHFLLLKDLYDERANTADGTWWAARLDQKIADMKIAIDCLEAKP